MPVLAHVRRMLLPLAIVLAIVAIAVPTWGLVGCDMDMGAMPFVPFSGAHLSAECPGEWALSSTPASSLPSSANTLILTLVAALFTAVLLFAPQVAGRRVLARVNNPPPPPDEPRGERFRV